MTHILGIDPGATTGWCLYDATKRTAIASGCFETHRVAPMWAACCQRSVVIDTIVIERPVGYGPTRPQLVDCGYVCGRLVEWFAECGPVELTRRDVKSALTEATLRDVVVKNDATAWAALVLLHGGELAAKKGGPLHGVKSHARAALAVAVAFALRNESSATKEGATA